MSNPSEPAAEELASDQIFIDFEIDSEWKKCIYSDCSRAGPQRSRNNSSTALPASSSPVPVPEPGFLHGCQKTLRQSFEATSLRRDAHSVTLWLCVRKHNYENYLWQFVRLGRFHGSEAYSNLSLWTVQLRVRMHRRVPFGCLLRGLCCRFGLGSTSEALKLCLDGFYGMPGFGDIFGNHSDVPWMEISNQSTADSLQLHDGDIIFVSYSNEKLESLARARKRALVNQSASSNVARSFAPRSSTTSDTDSISLAPFGKLSKPISQNAMPLADSVSPPPLHMATKMPTQPRARCASMPAAHPGQPMCISAAATSADIQFCEAVINTSKTELDQSLAEDGIETEVFAKDGWGLHPGALNKLHQAHSDIGDLVRVSYPSSKRTEKLGLVLTPELMTWMLDAAKDHRTPLIHPLLPKIRAKVFRCDTASDVDAADGLGAGIGAGRGALEELRNFASKVDSMLRVRCAGSGSFLDIWSPESAAYFVVDTFFGSSICSIYGIERDHRFHSYAVDAALHELEKGFVTFFSGTSGSQAKLGKADLDKAWENLYRLHPTAQELAAAEPSVQESLLAEIDSMATAARPHEFRRLTLKELDEMPFLEAFVKEVYRLTSGQFVSFRAGTDLLLQTHKNSEGICLHSGEEIGVLLRSLNMDPSLFKNPEAFQPQRFLFETQHAELLALPFGCLWPRRRLGLLKLKLFLVLLLSRCRIRADEGTGAQVDASAFCVDILPWTEDVVFQFQAREQMRATFTL
uniref:FERM domain-containing protein n=1 Tax=Macrostomum lignano TaxID=282301 RepID=A0A1I8FUR6_9PLAT